MYNEISIKSIFPIIVFCIGLPCVLIAQSSPVEIKSKKNGFIFRLHEEVVLMENLQPQPIGLNHVAFNDEFVVVSSMLPASVIVYDRKSGEQLRVLGNVGDGPFEYRQVTHVQIKDSKVFVNCSNNGLLVFDITGKGIRQAVYPSQIVTHFDVDESSDIFAVYNNFSSDKYFIDVYDLNGVKKQTKLGLGTDNDVWLRSFTHAGGITIDYPYVVYVLKDENKIVRHNLNTNRASSVLLDNERYVSPIFDRSRDQIQSDPTLLFSYLMNRSIGSSLYKIGEYYFYEVDHRNESTSNYSEFQILNSNLEFVDSIVVGEEIHSVLGEYSHSSYNNQIGYFNTDSSSGQSKVSFITVSRDR